jgi:hypothetical protein
MMKNNTECITLVNKESVRYPVYVHPVAQSMGNVLSIILSISNFSMKKRHAVVIRSTEDFCKDETFVFVE